MKRFLRVLFICLLPIALSNALAIDEEAGELTVRALDCEFRVPAKYKIVVNENTSFVSNLDDEYARFIISRRGEALEANRFRIIGEKQAEHLTILEYELIDDSIAPLPEDRRFVKVQSEEQELTFLGGAQKLVDQIVAQCLESVPDRIKATHALRAKGCKYELPVMSAYAFIWPESGVSLLFSDGKRLGVLVQGIDDESLLAREGLQSNDIITGICGVPYDTAATMIDSVCCQTGEPDSLLLTVKRGMDYFDVVIPGKEQ